MSRKAINHIRRSISPLTKGDHFHKTCYYLEQNLNGEFKCNLFIWNFPTQQLDKETQEYTMPRSDELCLELRPIKESKK